MPDQEPKKQVFILWRDEYSVRNEEIDSQHRQLIVIINELYSALQEGDGPRTLGVIIERMDEYARIHLDTEERLLRVHEYPHIEEHKRSHEELLNTLNSLKISHENFRCDVSMELLRTLKEWWQMHEMRFDRKYVPYISGAKEPP